VAIEAPGLATAAEVLVAEDDAGPTHRAAQLLRELEIAREHLPVGSGEEQVALRVAQRLFEVRLQLGMDRDRLLVVAFREITRPRVTDENEFARQVDVAALETRQLALAQTSVDGRCLERSPERLDLEQGRNDLVRFEEGGLPLRLSPPANALGRVRPAPLLYADGCSEIRDARAGACGSRRWPSTSSPSAAAD